MLEKSTIEELIVRYLQQEITEEELRLLEVWLEESIENKKYFFQLKSISDSSKRSAFSEENVNEASWLKMKVRLEQEQVPSSKKTLIKVFSFKCVKYVAVLILAIGVGWSFHELQDKFENNDQKKGEIVYNELRIEKGGRVNTLTLSDGSKVFLNASTTFKYPTTFGNQDRMVYLDGEAYFEVTENTEKPFVVKLKKQDITVLGTTFNVKAHSEEEYSVVSLFSGRISLEAFNKKGETMSLMFLKPNQQAYADNNTGSVSIQNTDVSLSNAWIRGEYKFKEEPLFSIIKQLENYYGMKIHIDSERLKNVKYTGTFSLDQDIKEVFHIIDYEKRFSIKYDKNEIFITCK